MASASGKAAQGPIEPMRVLLVSGEFPPMQGGVGDYTRELARALARLGHSVSVLTSVKGTWSEPGITLFPIMTSWTYQCWSEIMRTARQVQADIVHTQYQTAAFGMHPAINFFPLRLRLSLGHARTVVTFHDLRVPYLFPKAGPVRRWVTLELARRSDVAVVTNVEDSIALGNARIPFHVIPIGSNISTAVPAGYDRAGWRRRLGVGPEETLVSYFGFLNESKGGETLIRALWDVTKQERDVKLIMVGGQVGDSDRTNADYLERTKQLIDELRLGNRVLWTGFTSDAEVSANLIASDMVVLPYRDGASYRRGSFIAALSHGLPIVSTRGPGTTPLSSVPNVRLDESLPDLADSDNVLLTSPDDPIATSRAIIRLMASPALRQRLSISARVLAQAFDWDSIARRTSKVYALAISGKKQR